jgi:hypothetical protein
MNRAAEALEAAGPLAQAAPADVLSHAIAAAASDSASLAGEADVAARIAQLPVFTQAEAYLLGSGVVRPEARTKRR